MKLSEYFRQQHSQKIPINIKDNIFSRIQKEKNGIEISTKIPSKIFFFASKRIMYTSLTIILVFIVFGGFLLDKNQVVDFGIFSVKENNSPNSALADYVAEIIEFNGDYSLIRNEKIIVNSDNLTIIQDGDIVSFPEGTDLIFNLQDGTHAKIIGPAEFSISKTDKGYQISLFDGKFFRIYCPECTSNVDIITPDFSISQEKDQTLDLHIAKEENGKMLVKNDGDEITVKTKNYENKTEVKQISSELVAIAPDSDKINIIEDSEIMLNFMAKNNISATFTLSTENVEWPTIKNEDKNKLTTEQINQDKQPIDNNTESKKNTELISENTISTTEEKDPILEGIKEIILSDNEELGTINEDIATKLGLSSNEEQKVPTTSQMQILTTNLNSFFLMNLFENIYNQDKKEQNISKLADRINGISSEFGYSYKANGNLSDIKITIQYLKNQLKKNRYISPSYIIQMEKIIKWCDELENSHQTDWETFKSDLPIDLRLM